MIRAGDNNRVYNKAKRYYNYNKDNYDFIIDEINTRPFLTPKGFKKILMVPTEGIKRYSTYQAANKETKPTPVFLGRLKKLNYNITQYKHFH